MRRPQAGFTLMELMIAVAIVGILGAVALPAYQGAVLKGKRAEGRAALVDFAQQQERYFTQNNAYYPIATPGAAGTPFKTYSSDQQSESNYLLGTDVCPGSPAPPLSACIKFIAQRKGGTTADPEVGDLTMLSTGLKACTGSNVKACWP